MWEYGEVAVLAVELARSGRGMTPAAAWKAAADRLLATDSLRKKNCPRSTFLSLCQEGYIVGIPAGDYTKARENREYAMEAVRRLVDAPDLAAHGPGHLWSLVLGKGDTAYNEQMHVVLALWTSGLIASDTAQCLH